MMQSISKRCAGLQTRRKNEPEGSYYIVLKDIVFMIVIIDGYNLIRQSDTLRRYERKSLEEGRRALIARLLDYEKKKQHKITVVFDGWKSGSADEGRDREGAIDIIYSSYGEKADDVIKRQILRAVGDVIVVSSDREISSFATREGKTALSSPDFETILKNVIYEPETAKPASPAKNDLGDRQTKKKGPSRRLPRAKRREQKKIEKLV
jgi:hypothetical protein